MITNTIVLPLKAHLAVFDVQQAVVRDRHPMCVTAHVIEHLLRSSKRTLGIHHPISMLQEWLKFLRVIDDVTPADKQLHLIADNYATHKHAKVQRWLARHPRIHVHFTPTSSSWLNMVERFFRDLTDKRLRRGVFRDVEELIMAILDYIDEHNRVPKPFIWTAKAADILEKVKRARTVLHKRHSA